VKRILIMALLGASACGGDGRGEGPVQRVTVPPGASFGAVTDSLDAHGLLGSPVFFRLYARATDQTSKVQAGTYEFHEGTGYKVILDDLTSGRIASDRVAVPEGYSIQRIAPSLAAVLGLPADSVARHMLDTAAASRYQVPGPTLEGYLYPATYVVPAGANLESVLQQMVREHTRRWTPERQALADSVGLTHREVVTLASIVEKEARVATEMRDIAAVYRNRLDIGYPLQADPTVQYALGEHQNRLLYAHIDSVADHPYNTYTQPGIPPGPIGSPTERAIDAVLHPADVDYLYFVAQPDGTHVFNRHLVDHNEAKARISREQRANRQSADPDRTQAESGREGNAADSQ
jgi:UPF0755 protein